MRLAALHVTSDPVGVRLHQKVDKLQRTLGVEIEAISDVGVEVAVQEVENRARKVPLSTCRILHPDQDLVLLRLVEALDQRGSDPELLDGRPQLDEVGLLLELDVDLGAADEVDSEVEPVTEELVAQARDDGQCRQGECDSPVGQERDIGVADDAHDCLAAPIRCSGSRPSRGRTSPPCKWCGTRTRP